MDMKLHHFFIWAGLAFKPITHHRAHDAITVPYNDNSNRLFGILIDYNKPSPHLSCNKAKTEDVPHHPT
ncbi:hypothetical protein OUZ56_010012 [Daphnia magna]|uniref:Uncharacterized protein n=1 Tax=Daphnia magna TaxID=35525 RepID=A0ABR0AHJ0_9CRUS|nr:hypothetical protein OUZ56_010012 [Daphnia magna]